MSSLLDDILDRGYLRVGTTGDYRPFTYQAAPNNNNNNNTTSSYIGADIDLANALSSGLSLASPVQFVATTWSNLSADLAAGAFDIAMGGISITLARATQFYLSDPVARAGKVACIRCTDAAKFTSLATLDVVGTTVVVNAGGTNQAFDEANLKHAALLVLEGNAGVYDAVVEGRADAMISDVNEVELEVRLSNGTLCLLGDAAAPWTFEQLGYLMPRDEAWRSFVNIWLGMQVGNGVLNETIDEWMSYDWNAV